MAVLKILHPASGSDMKEPLASEITMGLDDLQGEEGSGC